MRYNNTNKTKDKNNKLYYSPSFVSNIPLKDSDIFVPVSEGARFDMLAQRYYGDSNLWWIIAKANEMGKGKLGIDVTKKIRIPTEIDDIIDSLT
tara:strand:- start:486 stop:767 length:282 start_codon:yes stop_codon:yes gene_type:complete